MQYAKLNGRIHEYYRTQKSLAENLGMTSSYLSKRLRGEVPFSINDIRTISNALNIPVDSIGEYFFTK